MQQVRVYTILTLFRMSIGGTLRRHSVCVWPWAVHCIQTKQQQGGNDLEQGLHAVGSPVESRNTSV